MEKSIGFGTKYSGDISQFSKMGQEINLIFNTSEFKISLFPSNQLKLDSHIQISLNENLKCTCCSQDLELTVFLVDQDFEPLNAVRVKEEPSEVFEPKIELLDQNYEELPIEKCPVKRPIEQKSSSLNDFIEKSRKNEEEENDDEFPPQTLSKRRIRAKPDYQQIFQPLNELSGDCSGDFYEKYEILRKSIISQDNYYSTEVLKNQMTLHFFKPKKKSLLYVSFCDLRENTCDICDFKGKNLIGFIQHYFKHFFEGEEPNCLACNEEFSNHDSRITHSLICMAKDQLNLTECRVCKKNMGSIRAKQKHEKTHADPTSKQKICHICSKVLGDLYALKTHLRKNHYIEPYVCAHCPKTCGNVSALRSHLIRHHFQHLANFKCELCNQVFATVALKNKHVKAHKSGACPICGKIFSSEGNVKSHMKTAHTTFEDKEKFYCSVCSKLYFSKYSLEMHQLTHLPEDKWQFQCNICLKKFPSNQKKYNCEKSHKNPPSVCTFCGKPFSDRQYLKDHMNLHTGEKPYECKVCSKKFGDRGNLRSHLKQHEKQTGEKLTLTKEERKLIKFNLINPSN